MNREPLKHDLVSALMQRPMTAREAGDAIGTSTQATRKALQRMHELGIVRIRGFSNPPKPAFLFELCI